MIRGSLEILSVANFPPYNAPQGNKVQNSSQPLVECLIIFKYTHSNLFQALTDCR